MQLERLINKDDFFKLSKDDKLLVQKRSGEIVLGTFIKIFMNEDIVFYNPIRECEDEFTIDLLLANKSSAIEVIKIS